MEDSEITVIKKIDGLVIMAENWAVFRPTWHLKLTRFFDMKRIKTSGHRGLNLSDKDRDCYQLKIGECQGMPILLNISVLKRSGSDVKFGPIIKSVASCLSNAVHQMPKSNTYIDWLVRVNPAARNTVFMDDIVEFGNIFMSLIKAEVDLMFESDPDVLVKILLQHLGHDTSIQNLNTILQQYNLEHIEKLVFHYAKDFALPNHLLGWSYSKIKELFGTASCEYYPGLLRGIGNFLFTSEEKLSQDLYKVNKLLHVSEDLSQGLYMADKFTISKIQFYFSLFKTVHRANPLPFENIKIAKNLFSPAEFTKYFCKTKPDNWKRGKEEVEMILKLLDNIAVKYQQGQYARVEFVVSVRPPIDTNILFDWMERIEIHHIYSSANFIRCLEKVNLDDLLNHLTLNFKPLINTLLSMINGRILALNRGTIEEFTTDDYGTATLCEAIICFTLYGTADSRNGKPMFPRWLQDTLGLDFRKYRKSESGEPVAKKFIFADRLELYEAGYDTPLVFLSKWNYSSGIELLSFVPMIDCVSKGVIKLIKSLSTLAQKEKDLMLAVEEVYELSCEDIETLDTCVNFFIKCLNYSVYEFCNIKKKFDGQFLSYDCFYGYAMGDTRGRVKLMTSLEFFNAIFENQDLTTGHSFIRWIVNLIKWTVDSTDCFEAYKSKIASKLEKELLNQAVAFVFPIASYNQYNRIIVLPVVGNGSLNFEMIGKVNQHRLAWLYMQWGTGLKLEINGIIRGLQISNGWKAETPMDFILKRMVEKSNVPEVGF